MAEERATKRLKYCDSEERAALKGRCTEDEEEEKTYVQFSPTKLRHHVQQQQQPCSEPRSGVGSYSTLEGISSSNKKFEVFISHRGPDTKHTLAYHMYDLLRDRGVEVFLDKEELQSGERFPLAIEEAIACTKVDVCILSRGYAESVWCLKELEMILHKYDMGRSKLIPIFYDVTPSEVRHLQGPFGQGFRKIMGKNRYSSELIHKWRRALYKIAEINGAEGKGECCLAIVNKILEELDVGLVALPINVVGRHEELLGVKHDIMRCHQNRCGVTSVEISGVGGIGKTIFAKQLYNQICPQYKRCCFIEDVGGLVEKYGVKEVHNQLISKLLRYEPRNMRMEGKKLLMDRLHNAEILVVFDNIHGKIPLSAVFIEDDVCLNPRSIIIVTSREKAILKHDFRAARYCQNLISLEIPHLDFDASQELFCQYAFGGSGNVSNEFNELIKKFVTKCHGIPLALIVFGSQLYRREIKFWKILWNFMKDSLHPDLQKILKISYDHLDSELEKCLFLDVATFLRWEKEDLLVKLRQCDEDGESEILYALDVLKRKNLIEVVNGVLMMHDLLVDLGRSIVQDEDSCPGHRSRVWDPSDIREMLSDDEMGTEKVKALSLVSQGLPVLEEDEYPWPADAFRKLSSLEFLILQGHCIEGDLSKLSKKLLWLKWTDFPYEVIPPTLCLKRVKILHLSGKDLTWLWEHHPQKEAPTYIRQLSLSNCMNLQRLPEFTGKFRQLSCIELRECTSLETIPDSFGQLKALKHLQLIRCEALVLLPETFGDFKSLCTLEMTSCLKIKSLPKSFGELSQLQELNMYRCLALECLPESFGKLSWLEILKLSECRALELLPESFGKLSQLKILRLSGCGALQCLPKSFGALLQLKILNLSFCKALQCLPQSFGHLLRLQDLEIYVCGGMKVLSESFGCLTNLLRLKVIRCPKIRLSTKQFQRLQGIQELYISNHEDNMGIAYSSCGQMSRAEEQNIGCWENSKWHGQPSQQKHLTSLVREISHGTQVKRQNRDAADLLSDNNQHAPQLSEVELIANQFLQRQGSATHPLQQMHELSLVGFWNLQQLPQSIGDLVHLKTLKLWNCVNLQWLPDSAIGSLSSLEVLELALCLNLKLLPSSIGNLPHLQRLCLQSCWNLEKLPDTMGNLQNLTVLEIHDCIVLEGLPSWVGNLSSLESLEVSFCWMVEVIHMQRLLNLETLVVIGCVNLNNIVGFSGLAKLYDITIEGCLNLTHMPVIRGCASFTCLQRLSICGCYQLCPDSVEGVVEHLPNELEDLRLSLNHDFLNASFNKETKLHLYKLPDILGSSSHGKEGQRALNAKTSPVLFSAVEERVRHLLISENDSFYSFHRLSHDPRVPFVQFNNKEYAAAVLCSVSAVYAVDLPMHIPPPKTQFCLSMQGGIFQSTRIVTFERFDIGEEIHMETLSNRHFISGSGGYELYFEVSKCSDSYYPSYEVFVKEGWLIMLQNELRVAEIYNIFYWELIKQRWLSRAWTELPSQLRISEFSALDIAGCQITKICRHCNTYIMEEELGLTLKRRRRLFMDDHALLLKQPRRNNSKHSYLAYLGLHHDLEVGELANLYEMSISISIKGQLVHSRKLQQIVSTDEQKIPLALNTLLQTNASHSTLVALHRKKLDKMGCQQISFEFH